MAKLEVKVETKYNLVLTADELKGLAALIGHGSYKETIDTLNLKSLMEQIRQEIGTSNHGHKFATLAKVQSNKDEEW